jgi:hypothetical protein
MVTVIPWLTTERDQVVGRLARVSAYLPQLIGPRPTGVRSWGSARQVGSAAGWLIYLWAVCVGVRAAR